MEIKPRRLLGRTQFEATVLGAGDVADRALGLERCAALLRRALDAGINVVDTAPAYENGLSEQIVGRALAGRRDGVFVIDKVDHLSSPVLPQIDGSIERLGFAPNAFVMHAVSDLAQWQALAAPGGAMAQLGDAIQAGRCRFRGISSHHPEVARAAIRSGLCDIILFAIGPHADERYASELLPLAQAHGVGTVCFKTFGAGKLLAPTGGYGQPLPEGTVTGPTLSVEECLHFTLTQDPDVALLGLSTEAEQDAAFAALARFSPLSATELAELRQRAAVAIANKGRNWWDPAPSA